MNVKIDYCKSIEEMVELKRKLEEVLEKVNSKIRETKFELSIVSLHDELGLPMQR